MIVKKNNPCKNVSVQNFLLVQKCLRAKFSTCAKVSSCNFVRSLKFDSYPNFSVSYKCLVISFINIFFLFSTYWLTSHLVELESDYLINTGRLMDYFFKYLQFRCSRFNREIRKKLDNIFLSIYFCLLFNHLIFFSQFDVKSSF